MSPSTERPRFMRAKMIVKEVRRVAWQNGKEIQYQDAITCAAVSRSSPYPADGSDEDNTFAKFSPTGELTLTIANPALIGKIEPGTKFYLDFTPAD